MGINVSKPDLIRLPNDRTDTYVMALKKCITSQLQLVVAISPTMRDDRYAAIKKICCADNPVPSQVNITKINFVNYYSYLKKRYSSNYVYCNELIKL